jgi:hypothetical protein
LSKDEEEVGNFGSNSDGSEYGEEDNNCDIIEGKKDLGMVKRMIA